MAPALKEKKSEKVPKVAAKKPGRPKVSTKTENTKKVSTEKAPKDLKDDKKRGRPKGSTNIVSQRPKVKKLIKKLTQGGEKKRGRPKTKPDAEYPIKFIDRVLRALKALDNKRGTSLQAVKKYLQESDGIDPKKKAIFINKSIRKLTEDGVLTHRAGTGANGTFKLSKKVE